MLAGLLRSLGALAVDPARVRDLCLVVVDNDAAGSAAQVVRAARLPFPVVYAVEPARNIARARNRGVALALARGAEWLAFVDDDETVSPRWLDELVRVQARTGADVVQGPVEPRVDPGAPRWVADGALFRAPRPPDGTPVRAPHTANVLVSARLFRELGDPPFSPVYGVSGGSDWHFFLRARLAGATAVWAHDALVWETVPASRARAAWLLRRSFRTGNAGAFIDRELLPLRAWLPVRLARTAALLGLGLVTLPPALVLGRARAVASARHVAHALGSLAGMAGWRYHEYRQRDGG